MVRSGSGIDTALVVLSIVFCVFIHQHSIGLAGINLAGHCGSCVSTPCHVKEGYAMENSVALSDHVASEINSSVPAAFHAHLKRKSFFSCVWGHFLSLHPL